MIWCIRLGFLPFYCLIVWAIQYSIENGHAKDLDKPFILHNDLDINLIASEPDIVDPVALAFDHDCRLYVVEMHDYPNGVPKKNKGGAVKLLTDTNRDGRYDRITLFANNLSYPTSVAAWKEGILVAAPPDIVYLKDTDGDGLSDIRETLISGFKLGVTDSNFNSLRWSLDNWIHGANGGNGGKVRFTGNNEPTTSLRNLDFRFRPDIRQLETTSQTGGGFGLVFNEWGHSFTTYNIDYLQQRIIPQKYIDRAQNLRSFEATKNISVHGKMARIFPIAEAETRVNHPEQAGYFSSAGGMGYLGIAGYPGDLSGSVFVCDVVGNLIHRNLLKLNGGAYISMRSPIEKTSEFFASSDNHFRPIAVELGPDGALYIADMQRAVIEHPDYIPSKIKRGKNIREGENRGRVYRISPKPNFSQSTSKSKPVKLVNLEQEFANPNQWRRLTAQRLIYESRDKSLMPRLRKLTRHKSDLARLHALWSLQGLGIIEQSDLLAGLADPNPRIRENVIRLVEESGMIGDQLIHHKLVDLAKDTDSTVRFQLALTLGKAEPTPSVQSALETIYLKGHQDEWTRKAVLCSLKGDEVKFASSMITRIPPAYLQELFELSASRIENKTDLQNLIITTLGASWEKDEKVQLLNALRSGISRSPNLKSLKHLNIRSLDTGLDSLNLELKMELHQLSVTASADPFLNAANIEKIIRQSPKLDGTNSQQIKQYIRFIADTTQSKAVIDKLISIIKSGVNNEIQMTAINALAGITDDSQPSNLVSLWPDVLPSNRSQLINLFVYNSRFKEAFLTALELKNITLGEANLDLEHRRQLIRYSGSTIGNRAKKLFGDEEYSNRMSIVGDWLGKLPKNGDTKRGKEYFKNLCANCHKSRGEGHALGPELEGLNHRSVEDLASNIIDPNMAINPRYAPYKIITKSGDTYVGILSNQSSNSVTISMPLSISMNVNRSDIAQLQSMRSSLMPSGLEKSLTPAGLRDVIEYIRLSATLKSQP
jgi:putative membrane-bound dehydrogenase-like protein